jgi:hypothetical protein
MDLIEKKNELIELITKYLEKNVSTEQLQTFSWSVINYFSKYKKDQLPQYQKFEKEFWYAIWEIQHLADEEHENEGVTIRILKEALEFLKESKKIPDEYAGRRP